MKESSKKDKRREKDPAARTLSRLSREAGTFDMSLSISLRSMDHRAAKAFEDESLVRCLGKERMEEFCSRYKEIEKKIVSERSRLRDAMREASRLFKELAAEAAGDEEEKDA